MQNRQKVTFIKEHIFSGMNKLTYMAGVAIAAMAISSCDEDTMTIGNSLTDENDILDIKPGTFYATSRTIIADSVLSLSTSSYLGRVIDPETPNNAEVTSEFTTQFHVMENVYISPEKYIKGRTTDGRAKADSCQIVFYLNSTFRDIDSLASMKMQVLEMSKPVDYAQKYYSNFDPIKEGYIRTDGVKKSVMFSYQNYQTPDSLGAPTNRIRVWLNDPYTDKNGKTYENYGTYVLHQYYDHPEYFRNSYTLTQNICPGFFFHITDGLGYYAKVRAVGVQVFYDVETPDTSYRASLTLAGTKEVKQTNLITNDHEAMKLLASNNDYTYLKTPAGLFTEVTLPVKDIKTGHENDSLIATKIIFQRMNYKSNDARMLSVPSSILMVKKDSLNTFFEKQQVNDGKRSFFTNYSSTNNTYSFVNISTLISDMWRIRTQGVASNPNWEAEHPDWNKVVLVPITYSTSSTNSTIATRIDHNMSLTSTRLVGGSNHPIEVSVVYAKFQ